MRKLTGDVTIDSTSDDQRQRSSFVRLVILYIARSSAPAKIDIYLPQRPMGSHSRNRSRSRSPDRGKDRDRERHGHRHRNRSSSPRRDRHREDRNRSHGTDRDRGHDHLKNKRDKVHGTTPSDEESLLDLDEMGVKEISEEDYL